MTIESTTTELLSPEDLMKILRLKRSKVYELLRTMPTIRIARGVRVRREALEEWLRDHEEPPRRPR